MKTLVVLANGSAFYTTQNTAEDIAGLINAGVQKVYQVQDTEGQVHHVVVSAIIEVLNVPSN